MQGIPPYKWHSCRRARRCCASGPSSSEGPRTLTSTNLDEASIALAEKNAKGGHVPCDLALRAAPALKRQYRGDNSKPTQHGVRQSRFYTSVYVVRPLRSCNNRARARTPLGAGRASLIARRMIKPTNLRHLENDRSAVDNGRVRSHLRREPRPAGDRPVGIYYGGVRCRLIAASFRPSGGQGSNLSRTGTHVSLTAPTPSVCAQRETAMREE